VAYLLSLILSFRTGLIVSDAELVGRGAASFRMGARAMWRLTSWVRARGALSGNTFDAVEAGAGYATSAPSPGMTAPATPAPNAVITAAGTAILATRTAKGGRIARRGRG